MVADQGQEISDSSLAVVKISACRWPELSLIVKATCVREKEGEQPRGVAAKSWGAIGAHRSAGEREREREVRRWPGVKVAINFSSRD